MLAVLRLGHRPMRDKRITTHVCLTARAFGADRVVLHGRDPALVANVRGVTARFGGAFEVAEDTRAWKRILADWPGKVAHLTMYGEPHTAVMPALRAAADDPATGLLLVVGAEKVPGDLYRIADWNVAVGNQPHSEVAALAVVLQGLRPDALEATPADGALRIEPAARGKRVVAGEDRPASQESTGEAAGPSGGSALPWR